MRPGVYKVGLEIVDELGYGRWDDGRVVRGLGLEHVRLQDQIGEAVDRRARSSPGAVDDVQQARPAGLDLYTAPSAGSRRRQRGAGGGGHRARGGRAHPCDGEGVQKGRHLDKVGEAREVERPHRRSGCCPFADFCDAALGSGQKFRCCRFIRADHFACRGPICFLT